MLRRRYLRWWLAALAACVLSFLSLWLPPGRGGGSARWWGDWPLMVALDWAFLALSYITLLGCAGWEGRLPWLLWQLLPVFGYGSAVVLLVVGIRARWRIGREGRALLGSFADG